MGKDDFEYQTELVCMVPMHDTSAADAARSATHLLSDAVGPSIGNRGKGSDGAEGPFWNFGPVGWTSGARRGFAFAEKTRFADGRGAPRRAFRDALQ